MNFLVQYTIKCLVDFQKLVYEDITGIGNSLNIGIKFYTSAYM